VTMLIFARVVRDSDSQALSQEVCLGDARPFVSGSNLLTLQVQAQAPLRQVRIVMLCDLQRVAVRGIFVGTHLLAWSPSSTVPFAWTDSVLPGVIIRANVEHLP